MRLGVLVARATRAVLASTDLLMNLSSSFSWVALVLEADDVLAVLLRKLLSPGLGQPVRDGTHQLYCESSAAVMAFRPRTCCRADRGAA